MNVNARTAAPDMGTAKPARSTTEKTVRAPIAAKPGMRAKNKREYNKNENMFKIAMEQNDLEANEIIHIGDSLSSDISGANNVKIKSIWLNRKDRQNKSNAIPDMIAKDLIEIIENINKLI
jgi:2-haloacid dehalogenase/putative hydrolase of the HAD superfamily